jgi:hypothetical protein
VAERRAAVACIAAGVAWLALVPASVLLRGDDLSGAGYHRVMAVALWLLVAAWWYFGRAWRPEGFRARNGFWLGLAGFALAAVGAPFEAAGPFLLGVLLLLVAGPTAAVALRRAALPLWALALICLVGFGVLFGDLFAEAPLAAAAGGIGFFAAGWIGLGMLLWRQPYAFSSTPT